MKNQSSTEAMAHALLHGAARRAPPQLRERLEEEWLADMATRRGALARLLFALGCRWAARTIALEFGVPARAVALRVATATAAGPAVVPARPSAPQGSPRFIFLVAIIGLHVALACALIRAFVPPAGEKGPTSFDTTFIDQFAPPVEPPPGVPPATLVNPIRVVLPPPVVTIETPTATERTITTTLPPLHPTQPPAHPVRRVAAGLGAAFPNAADFYPELYRRLGNEKEGAATVRVCVDGAGRLAGEPAIAQTSGDALFDASALDLARAGSGRYRAASEDGRPVDSCFPFRVRFQMR